MTHQETISAYKEMTKRFGIISEFQAAQIRNLPLSVAQVASATAEVDIERRCVEYTIDEVSGWRKYVLRGRWGRSAFFKKQFGVIDTILKHILWDDTHLRIRYLGGVVYESPEE